MSHWLYFMARDLPWRTTRTSRHATRTGRWRKLGVRFANSNCCEPILTFDLSRLLTALPGRPHSKDRVWDVAILVPNCWRLLEYKAVRPSLSWYDTVCRDYAITVVWWTDYLAQYSYGKGRGSIERNIALTSCLTPPNYSTTWSQFSSGGKRTSAWTYVLIGQLKQDGDSTCRPSLSQCRRHTWATK
jgi:hypothetical protein